MSDESLSKRERQKARRDAKLRAERAQAAKARRNRIVIFALVGAILVGLVGVVVNNQLAQRRAAAEQREAVAAQLDELGCTEDSQQPDSGAGHFTNQSLAQNPPQRVYPDRPATSGQHFGRWVMTGVYDNVIDERALVHNLEHGYIVAYYDSDAPEEQVQALKDAAQARIDGDFPKIVVAPWDGQLPDDANFAYTAWRFRQLCREFDEDVFEVFVTAHHSGAGIAPEATLPPHTAPGSGMEPGGEPLLLPPLGGGAPTEDAPNMSEQPTDGSS